MKTKAFKRNTQCRDFFAGDLHGCYELFMQALEGVDFDFDIDRVFSVGDLIDRGENSELCLCLLHKPWFHCVMGNHEALMLGSHGTYTWYRNGGDWSRDIELDVLEGYRALIQEKCFNTLTVDTQRGTVGVVHAESVPVWSDNSDTSAERNTWARSKIKAGDCTPIEGIDLVVVGHSPLKAITRLGNVVYIDTGAVYPDGYLSLLSVDEVFDIAMLDAA